MGVTIARELFLRYQREAEDELADLVLTAGPIDLDQLGDKMARIILREVSRANDLAQAEVFRSYKQGVIDGRRSIGGDEA